MKKTISRNVLLLCALIYAGTLFANAYVQEVGESLQAAATATQTIVDADDYTWRLDEIRNRNYVGYDNELGDTLKEGSVIRFAYDSASFYTLEFMHVGEWSDSVEVLGRTTQTIYSLIGPNGKHRVESSSIRSRGGVVMSADSFAAYNPLADTIVRNGKYYDYAYDTYRNVYDENGSLIRQIRNYDMVECEMDYDSLFLAVLDTTHILTGDELLALYNRLPYYVNGRTIVTQTDSTATELILNTYNDYNTDSFYIYSQKNERFEQHRCIYSETKKYNYYNGKTITTTFNEYNLSGATIATGTITEKWNADSLQTSYSLSRQEFELGNKTRDLTDSRTFANGVITKKSLTDIVYGQDSIREVTDTYTYTYDTVGVDSTINRQERIYDRQTQKDLYLAKSTFAHGTWQLNSVQAWQLFDPTQGSVTKLTRDYAYHCKLYSNHPRYDCYLNKDLTYRYDQDGQLTFAQDSSSYLWFRYIQDDLGVYQLNIDTVYVYTNREWENGSLTHGRNYQYHFLNDWTLVNDTVVTDDYTQIAVINTADTTRTTSTTYNRPFGGNRSVKEKRNAITGEWELVSESSYTVVTNQNGVPQSATASTTDANGVTTQATYYIFKPWDSDKQCYTRNEIGYTYYNYKGELATHFFDAEVYTYYNKEGKVTGIFHNSCSTCELTDQNIHGIYKKAHYDSQDRIDTMRWYAFYGEWYPIRYDVYSYVPEGDGTDVAAIAHYTIDPSNYWYESDYKVDDAWAAGWWRRRLSGTLFTDEEPLQEMHYFGTDNYSHTYSTYNETGWLIETRQYNGEDGPVVRHRNVFTYDQQGRVLEHITYTDTLPSTRKRYFYDDTMTQDAVACVTWSKYDTASGTWQNTASTIYGASLYDEIGRLTTSVKYTIVSGDEMTVQPTERYDYLYEGDNTDWLLRDYYKWSDGQWLCQAPTYRGTDLNPIEIDAKGNLTSRSTGTIGCGGVHQAEYTWHFDYDTSLGGNQPMLSPEAYGVAESTLYSLFNGHQNVSRPVSGTYQHGTDQAYDILFRYTQLKDLPADTIPADTIPTDTIPSEPQEHIGYVTVEPSETTAYFTWPTDSAAEKYIIDIRKDGEIFCHLTLDAIGRLISIAFAPSQHDTHGVGETLSFMVTGLTEGTKYSYTVATLDEDETPIHVYKGEFATSGFTGLVNYGGEEIVPTPPVVPYDPMPVATWLDSTGDSLRNSTIKTIENGQLVIILPDGRRLNLRGERIL